ncbi:hypothetical protein KVR01_009068 [Diaporthe batatas]|uniref:uncharacterized protein n=1 Tax=Diaporthe batatas TaxID=748121 RepID=UPI001D05BF4E|nr:uncharacterized protein KVR01_009068 [Diaporthe batatas]KAG8160804.1 hypothetical protein KVR01_009068 [Diaporthe batatas]
MPALLTSIGKLLERLILDRFTFEIFAFVDDSYITVWSTSFARNCEGLTWVHGQLQQWADKNGHGVERRKDRPSIANLPPDEELFKHDEPFLNILGLRVDHRLSWKFHIDHVVSQVSKRMRALKQMSGSIWGPDLQRMRTLYTSQIQSAFSYASPVWFVTGLSPRRPGTLSAKLVGVLDKLQDECLVEISGAMAGTSAEVIRKELCVPKISTYLKMRTLSYLAKRTSHCPVYRELKAQRMATLWYPRPWKRFEHHPLQQLQTQADKVIKATRKRLRSFHGRDRMEETWSKPKARHRAIDRMATLAVHAWCRAHWDQYREGWDKRHNRPRPLALAESWGLDSLMYYDEMCRKECTMLLHCRTGNIGLAANLHSRALHPTESCPLCDEGRHTVEHLFVYCKGRDCYGREMAKRRAALHKSTDGVTDLHLIFAEYPEEAVRFAFKTFGIPQFTKASWKVTEAKKRGRSEAVAPAGDAGQDAPAPKRRRYAHLVLRQADPPPAPATAPGAAGLAT